MWSSPQQAEGQAMAPSGNWEEEEGEQDAATWSRET